MWANSEMLEQEERELCSSSISSSVMCGCVIRHSAMRGNRSHSHPQQYHRQPAPWQSIKIAPHISWRIIIPCNPQAAYTWATHTHTLTHMCTHSHVHSHTGAKRVNMFASFCSLCGLLAFYFYIGAASQPLFSESISPAMENYRRAPSATYGRLLAFRGYTTRSEKLHYDAYFCKTAVVILHFCQKCAITWLSNSFKV